MYDDVTREALSGDSELARFFDFYHRVLLGREDRAQYREMLASREMFAKVEQDLRHPGDEAPTPQELWRRMIEIDYLRAALGWLDNPEREVLMSLIESIILDDNFLPTMDDAARRAVAAGKMELYGLLAQQDPERAADLLAMARDTRIEALVAYIVNTTRYRRARDRALVAMP
jgi:hypothetical protein